MKDCSALQQKTSSCTHFPYILLLNKPYTLQKHCQRLFKHLYYRLITYLACVYIGGLEESLETQEKAVGRIRLMGGTHTEHTPLLPEFPFQPSTRALKFLLMIILCLLPLLPQRTDRRLRDLPHGVLVSDRIRPTSGMPAKWKMMGGSRQRMCARPYDSSPWKASSSIQDALIFAAFIFNGSKTTTKIHNHMR